MDYVCFEDGLAFDITYRENAYKKPLVVLVLIITTKLWYLVVYYRWVKVLLHMNECWRRFL